jgi:Catalytic LigB subunit of aromatic ring-opening dioxygenase
MAAQGGSLNMAKLVLGVGTSHTPMLNTPAEEWPSFIDRDGVRDFLDKEGEPATYEELLSRVEPHVAAELTPQRFAARHTEAQAGVAYLKDAIRRAELDALIVVGDDHKEIYQDDNLPGFVVYHGKTIRNVPPNSSVGPDWARRANARYYEEKEPREYPVESGLARHLIGELVDREFDPVSSDALPTGKGEGHAFAFVRKRLLENQALPMVPVFINTYFPPNQPTPRRCYKLGQAIREAVESYPGDARIGIVGSGGLSHFVVDEELDRQVIDACARKDADALQSLPRHKLNSGSSEIRMWICAAGAAEHLDVSWSRYVPGYRTPAGSGTGLGFALWT